MMRLKIEILHLLGDRAACRFAPGRGGHGRQPVLGIPAGAPAHMGELDHQRGAMGVDAVGEFAEIRDDAVIGDGDLVPGRGRTVHRHGGRAAEHGQADAALGLLLVIELIAQLRLALRAVGRRMAGAHDPVADRQALDRQRPKQGFEGSGHPRGLSLPLVQFAAAERRYPPETRQKLAGLRQKQPLTFRYDASTIFRHRIAQPHPQIFGK